MTAGSTPRTTGLPELRGPSALSWLLPEDFPCETQGRKGGICIKTESDRYPAEKSTEGADKL